MSNARKGPKATLGGSASTADTHLSAPGPAVTDEQLPPLTHHLYDLYEEVAHGGLGRIYRAVDRRLNREVAVKVLKVRTDRIEARFAREALITARLQHPGIVPVYEAGTWPDGEPFYAMRLVAGLPLSHLIAQRPALAERLALLPNVIAVADAIAYAHQRRVIHRDLKPANIMVGAHGETVVIDWGLAKDLSAKAREDPTPSDEPAAASPGETVAGTVLGTAAYMPPEQALGHEVDERADVYALGAVLYHLLRGAMPFAELTPAEARAHVIAGRVPDLAAQVAGLPEDLLAIARKAMATERARRYPSAGELAADLRRFETGQLVSVRTYEWYERLGRWARRHRAVVSVAAAAALALAAAAAVGVRGVVDERTRPGAAQAAAEAARADADRRRDQLVLAQATTALDRDPTAALGWVKQHPGSAALPRLRTLASDAASRGLSRHVLRGHQGRLTGLAFTADGSALVSCATDGRVLRWDLPTGRAAAPPELQGGVPWALAMSAGHQRFAVATAGKARLFTPGGAALAFPLGSAAMLALELSPDGTRLAAGTVNGQVWLWEHEGQTRRELTAHTAEVRDLAFSPDGELLASASFDGTVHLHRLGTAAVTRLRAHTDELWALDFSSDGRMLATGGADGLLRLWAVATGAKLAELPAGSVTHLQFSPDGAQLAAASRDHTVRLWASPFAKARALEGHQSDVLSVRFSPDGTLLASASSDATVRLWDVRSGRSRVLRGHEALVSLLAFSPDGQTLASAGQDGSVRLWDVRQGVTELSQGLERVALAPHGGLVLGARGGALVATDGAGFTAELPGALRAFDFATDERVVALTEGHQVVSWQPRSGERRTLGALPVDFGSAAEASGWVAVGAYDGTVRLWRLSDGREATWRAHPTYTLALQASPDGARLASAGEDGEVKLWSVASGEHRSLKGHLGPVHRLRFSRDGRLLASADVSGEVRLWQVATATLLGEDKHQGFVRALAFSSDGAWLASGGDDRVLHVRALASLEVRRLEGPELSVNELAFSRDGELLAAASQDLTVRVFEHRTGAARVLRGHASAVKRVAFAADGSLTSADGDGVVRRWPRAELTPLPPDRAALGRWADEASSAVIDADDRPTTPSGM